MEWFVFGHIVVVLSLKTFIACKQFIEELQSREEIMQQADERHEMFEAWGALIQEAVDNNKQEETKVNWKKEGF